MSNKGMSTFNAFYVRKQATGDSIRAAITSLYPKAEIQVLPEFIGAILYDIEPLEQKLKDLSATFGTDVIWVLFQTTAESFLFHYWRSGEQLRALCSNEGVWDQVEGQAEPWEAEEFWSEEVFEGALECAETGAERLRLRRLWQERVIRQGQTEPSVSCDSAVHAVMEHYGLSSDDAPQQTGSGVSGDDKPKARGVSGCLFVLLLIIAVLVFAVIGVVTVIIRIL
jgi:hypothetical protein